MPERDSQTFQLNRQSLLVVTGVGVGLLTLSYVLGVQVGKQSAALRRPLSRESGEELGRLPVPLGEQLKQIEKGVIQPTAPAQPQTTQPQAPTLPTPQPEPPKAEAKPEPKAAAEDIPQYTLQVVSTPDAEEARRVAAKVKGMGLECQIVKENGLHKVRLTKSGTKESLQKSHTRLKGIRLQPFYVRVD